MSVKLTASADELRKKFFALATARDVADLLEIDYGRLTYHIYKVPEEKRYAAYEIPKRAGGVRRISAPVTALKILQRKLNQILHEVYQLKPSVYGFARKRSILSNAKAHLNSRYVFNVDLKDFFPSINFGRVRGMFMGIPYELPEKAATVLAQICCFTNQLPQGGPTSPIISNMICAKMDSELQGLAEKHRCFYTRYADDITFSTSTRYFPEALAKSNSSGKLEVGQELERIIKDNGFEINLDKVRLRTKNRRQEVTGLTVNEFPNVRRTFIRQIRAMLHAWEKFGLPDAQREFLNKYDRKHRNPARKESSFPKVVRGRIEYVGSIRGKRDRLYLRFAKKLKMLAPAFASLDLDVLEGSLESSPLLITEGKTDWKHLKVALRKLQNKGLCVDLEVRFHEYERGKGDKKLLKECETLCETPHSRPLICVFDRDNKDTVKRVSGRDKPYKDWSNKVFSFPIPVPDHRRETPHICLEFYYQDSEIKRVDAQGRRLFISNEFNSISGRHEKGNLNCTDQDKYKKEMAIIDSRVFDVDHNSVALPKDAFANYVLTEADNFNDFDVSEFSKIFDVVSMIIEENRKDDE